MLNILRNVPSIISHNVCGIEVIVRLAWDYRWHKVTNLIKGGLGSAGCIGHGHVGSRRVPSRGGGHTWGLGLSTKHHHTHNTANIHPLLLCQGLRFTGCP